MKSVPDKPASSRDGKDIMTVEEVARYLRVHPATIYKLLKEDRIPGFRVGGDWRFRRQAIDGWMRSQQTK
jgi:excisionase family DNA binding protein